MSINQLTKIDIFQGQHIRRAYFENEWWFSVIDVVASLTNSETPSDYWAKMKRREKSTSDTKLSQICRRLKLAAPDGKKYPTDCANRKGLFRIIQSIPSSKAEPFKLWLAEVGDERIEEIKNPELCITRAKTLYEKKGYSENWINKRFQGIAARKIVTDVWSERGAQKRNDYATLTNDVMQGAFDLKVDNYKKLKGLESENLRDHMTDLELLVTTVGETATTHLTQQNNSMGMPQLRDDAQAGGAFAGETRKGFEKLLRRSVISKENFLTSNNSVSDNPIIAISGDRVK